MIKLTFNLKYFLFSIFIFFIEVLIATVLKDIFFIRAYLGDVIVMILLYTLVKSFVIIKDTRKLILGIFIFSCLIEWAQYFNIADKLGLQPGSIMYIIVGNSFSWVDIACYVVGCLLLLPFTKSEITI
ncbi:ribosomal maturation YjgA family protein [Chryseobacterium lineare]